MRNKLSNKSLIIIQYIRVIDFDFFFSLQLIFKIKIMSTRNAKECANIKLGAKKQCKTTPPSDNIDNILKNADTSQSKKGTGAKRGHKKKQPPLNDHGNDIDIGNQNQETVVPQNQIISDLLKDNNNGRGSYNINDGPNNINDGFNNDDDGFNNDDGFNVNNDEEADHGSLKP